MHYKLNIDFADEVLDTIEKARQKVVLVKHTAGNGDSAVAWVCFKPWENNTVEWKEEFAIYASNSQVQNGATITKLSDRQAVCGMTYPFEAGYFRTPTKSESYASNSYTIKNNYKDLDGITVGLAQDVVVNGEAFESNPINAVFLPCGQSANMTPIERVDIYLKNDIQDSTVITHISSVPLSIVYKEGESVKTVGYNSQTGEFYIKK